MADLPPGPNRFFNQWNLGLPWGLCSGPDCIARENLMKCGGCHAIRYCGPAHQKADRPRHKSSCKLVKNAREELAREEAALRARPGDEYLPENPFETARGSFWRWRPTRPYMEKRYILTAALLNIRTETAVETALEHSLEMLQLNRGDNQGIRSQVPGLYLRLGREQEAWDFIKFYATTAAASDYSWGPEDPFLDLHDEDIFERPEPYAEKLFDLSFLACLTNLKLRLLLDVQTLETQSKKPGNSNASYEKKMEWVREYPMSSVLYKRRDIVERSSWSDLFLDLQSQAEKMFDLVQKRNKHYWQALKTPDRWAAAIPTMYTAGSEEEINLVFRQTWYMWAECQPVLEIVSQWADIS